MAKTASKAAPITIDILPPAESAEALQVIREGTSLIGFVKGLAAFFKTATELEVSALGTLAKAKLLTVPTTKAEDAIVQDFIRTARAARKGVEDQWEITAIVSRFHKKLTAKRAVATDALKSAESLATTKHSAWVHEENRRAALETERLNREAGERAERDRLKVLEEFEALAVKAEEESPELSAREQVFVTFVVNGYPPDVAAQRAGYKRPTEQAARLFSTDKVFVAIASAKAAASLRKQKDATAALPVFVDEVDVAPALNKGDRYRWSAVCVDLETFRQAAFKGDVGIPLDCFVVDQARLNEYARSLEKKIELWPGISATRKNTVV